jgi:hypothetical protein
MIVGCALREFATMACGVFAFLVDCSISANNHPTNVVVVYGTSKISSGELRAVVEEIFLHLNSKSIDARGDYDNDFALLRLKEILDGIGQPIALPKPDSW